MVTLHSTSLVRLRQAGLGVSPGGPAALGAKDLPVGRRVGQFVGVLMSYIANLTGDARDEVILRDQEWVWVYMHEQTFSGERVDAPHPNADYNESSFRQVVSRPGWNKTGPEVARTVTGEAS